MTYSLLDWVDFWQIFIPKRLELLKTHHCAEFKKTVLVFLYLYQYGTVNSIKRIISFEECLKKSNQFQLSQMGIPQVSQIKSLTNAELENLMLKQGKLKFMFL